MATWDTICRVCASPAKYDVFSKIPAYLHATSNEFINWQKPISTLIEETTGLKISEDDGLPRSICALCISYLKHASTFRDQVIKNALSLKVVKEMQNEKNNTAATSKDKDSLLINEQHLSMSEQRRINTNDLSNIQLDPEQKVSKELFQAQLPMPSQDYIEQQMRFLNLLFNKDVNAGINNVDKPLIDEDENLLSTLRELSELEDYETETASDDENNVATSVDNKHIFSYKEKNFEEDDIMNLEELREVISMPENLNLKEHKCRACFRRFMFEERHKDHIENCVEYKFLTFIEEINLLLGIRRKKAVSPHECIRRMIFSLRKICCFLKTNCDEILLLPEPPANVNANDDSHIEENDVECEAPPTENSLLVGSVTQRDFDQIYVDDDSFLNTVSTKPKHNPPNADDISSILRELLLTSNSDDVVGKSTPISVHNNVLYKIERSLSRNNNDSEEIGIKLPNRNEDSNLNLHNDKLMRPIAVHPTTSTHMIHSKEFGSPVTQDENRIVFLQKLEQAAFETPKQNLITPLTTPSISVRKDLMPKSQTLVSSPATFSACCNLCNEIFDTISSFEIHNAMYHNKIIDRQPNETNKGAIRKRRNSNEDRERIIAMFENEDDI